MSRIDLYGFLGAAIGLLFGMIGHEYAHARAAVSLGDQTPRFMGRLTMNPKAHLDPFGTIIMPGVFLISLLFKSTFGFFFGYAKPVTINPGRLRNPRRDAMLVALAGPGFNLAVAITAGISFRIVTPALEDKFFSASADLGDWRRALLLVTIVNSFLFIINILPIPPLDGSKILARFLSPTAAMKMEEFGQYLIFVLIAFFLFFQGVLDNMGRAIYGPILGPPF
ncbi:MAG: site-2 protease family protein [Actinomycetota bacterium]